MSDIVEGEFDIFQQIGLIFFDDKKVLPARIDDLLANVPLTKHRIANDHFTLQYKGFEEVEDSLGFVGFCINSAIIVMLRSPQSVAQIIAANMALKG
jgi:hypothetical protein